MAQGTEPIRQDIDSLRDSMSDKIGQIEDRVRTTVDSTVSTVRETFDISSQVRARPWVAVGASVLAGYALGSMDGGNGRGNEYERVREAQYREASQRREHHSGTGSAYTDTGYSGESRSATASNLYSQPSMYEQSYRREEQRSSRNPLAGLTDQFADELDTLKTAAVAAAMNALRELFSQNLPQFSREYERVRQERQSEQDTGTTTSSTSSTPVSSTTTNPSINPSISSSSNPSTDPFTDPSTSSSSTRSTY